MFGMGPSEMILVMIVALLVFGRRLPEVSKTLGKSVRELKKGMSEFQTEVDSNLREDNK